jgi:hypothetical protein
LLTARHTSAAFRQNGRPSLDEPAPASTAIFVTEVIRGIETMTRELIERSRQRHAFAGLPVIVATLSLVVSLVVAATAVSIGIARADALVPMAGGSGGKLALAVFVGLVIACMGALTAGMAGDEVRTRQGE